MLGFRVILRNELEDETSQLHLFMQSAQQIHLLVQWFIYYNIKNKLDLFDNLWYNNYRREIEIFILIYINRRWTYDIGWTK